MRGAAGWDARWRLREEEDCEAAGVSGEGGESEQARMLRKLPTSLAAQTRLCIFIVCVAFAVSITIDGTADNACCGSSVAPQNHLSSASICVFIQLSFKLTSSKLISSEN